jgi:hypothetical protein
MIRLAFALAVFALIAAAGCRQNAPVTSAGSSLQIAVTVGPNPPVSGAAQLVVTVKDAGGQPINDATLSVRGDMTHAGMTPVLRDTISGQNGIYTVPFEWTMSGDWIVEVTAKLKDGTTSAQTFRYSVGAGSTPTSETNTSLSVTGEVTDVATAATNEMTMEATAEMNGMNMQAVPTATIPRGGG